MSDLIFVGVKGTDAADVLASTKGQIFALDAATGHVRWHNELKGLGFGLVAIAGASSQQLSAAAVKQRQQQQAAAAGAGS